MYIVKNNKTGQELLCTDYEVLKFLPAPTKIGEFARICGALTSGQQVETDIYTITHHEHERESAAVL